MNTNEARQFFADMQNKANDQGIGNITPENQNRLLYRISNTLLQLEDLDVILNKAIDETILAMNACTVSIALYDQTENKLVIKLIKRNNNENREPKIKEFKIGEGVAGLAAQKREIICVPKIEENGIFVGKCQSNAHSLIAVPMIFQSELVGVLNVSIKRGKKFTMQEGEFLTILSTVIAGSIRNSQLVEKIKKENDLLNSMIENSGEGIMVIDNKGKILMMNSYLEEILGMKKNDLHGTAGIIMSKKIGALDYVRKVIQALNSKNAAEKIYDELEITLPNGEKNWFSIATSFIRDAKGNIINTINVSRNITAEKKLLQAKNDLITTATHELRTPLTAIKGYLSMIQDTDLKKMDDKQIKYLNKAYSSTERLVNLVEDLLSTLKIDENKINLELIDFNLDNVILESINNLISKAQSKKIKIKYSPSQIFAHGDPVKSKHIIENLIDNAIKYTPVNGNITITTKDQTHHIQVAVKDTGVGIPQDESRSIIFDKFTRIYNALSVKAGGTGLGLYIAKNLIEKQGGRIWLESEQKKGSTFYFTIPTSTSFSPQNNF